jgi:hypothetical protein
MNTLHFRDTKLFNGKRVTAFLQSVAHSLHDVSLKHDPGLC